MIFNKVKGFKTVENKDFLRKAEELKPVLFKTKVVPTPSISEPMGKGDTLLLDFLDHQVGYLHFHASSVGSPADAPAKIRIRYAERKEELEENWDEYKGEISSSWLQEETFFLDYLPVTISLPRRHAFRYIEIKVIDTTPKYKVRLSHIHSISVSSADYRLVPEINIKDKMLKRIDEVSLRTMHECMQEVFEDGPKRDARLWLGDLRLQALGNYATFQNADLVKRCLYLFAGSTMRDGRVGAGLFHKPKVQVDDTILFDYSLFFVSTLKEYYDFTKDIETLKDLFPTAKRQISLSLLELDGKGIVKDHDNWWCFLDWGEGLNKQAGAQAILISALKDAKEMASILGLDTAVYDTNIDTLTFAAKKYLFDEAKGLFVSGKKKQISWASQIYFVLSGIFDKETNRKILSNIEKEPHSIKMVTPFLHHYYVMALLEVGEKEKAISVIKSYWGDMILDGADTFYEVYDPQNKRSSPYGDWVINSFCHAWSGTPSYFIRRHLG
ncbi:MAG: sugar hydrolase [Bacilli bacterium]|nr:sugar hydrolase [Bacilli bacterium]